MTTFVLALVATAAAAPVPDLKTAITAPTSSTVDVAATWSFKVSNTGTKDASGVKLFINLPATNTSPTVYVMGAVGTLPTGCTLSGTRVTCDVGLVKRGKSSTKSFTLALPESAGTLDFSTDASTTTSGDNTANNTASAVGSPSNVVVTAPTTDVDVDNSHCTGTGLESYYECELYPSSISSHTATFHPADNSISFDGMPDYWGSYAISGDQLWFEYEDASGVVAEFVGYGVANSTDNCWEGVTNFFPASSYVAPYRVCLP